MKRYNYMLNGTLIDSVEAHNYQKACILLDAKGYNLARGEILCVEAQVGYR